MGDIPSEIASRRKKAADLRRQADMLEAEARGLELASKIGAPMPAPAAGSFVEAAATIAGGQQVSISPAAPTPEFEAGAKRGRQKGAISKAWREVLMTLRNQYPSGFGEGNVCAVALALLGLQMRPKDARDRMKFYVELGYIQELGVNTFAVTDSAAHKFNDWAA